MRAGRGGVARQAMRCMRCMRCMKCMSCMSCMKCMGCMRCMRCRILCHRHGTLLVAKSRDRRGSWAMSHGRWVWGKAEDGKPGAEGG
jgi:hypothetical protein